jgi:hypothetical protein
MQMSTHDQRSRHTLLFTVGVAGSVIEIITGVQETDNKFSPYSMIPKRSLVYELVLVRSSKNSFNFHTTANLELGKF